MYVTVMNTCPIALGQPEIYAMLDHISLGEYKTDIDVWRFWFCIKLYDFR